MLAAAFLTTVQLAIVHIGVFGLFHPAELEVRPVQGSALVVESAGSTEVLEGAHSIRLRSAARVTGRGGVPARFTLSVPGRISREFVGVLEVRPKVSDGKDELLAIVEMDRETAVASIVAAEGSADDPIEAMKAQAVVARSFLIASHGRHEDFDFCDTTHCQFLRSPPAPGSAASRAAEDTRGLAIVYRGKVLAALYSANCGGHTQTLAEAGWHTGDAPGGYPYFAVACPVRGKVSGHRLGLCQIGSMELARRGATFRQILSRFFPATTIENPSGGMDARAAW